MTKVQCEVFTYICSCRFPACSVWQLVKKHGSTIIKLGRGHLDYQCSRSEANLLSIEKEMSSWNLENEDVGTKGWDWNNESVGYLERLKHARSVRRVLYSTTYHRILSSCFPPFIFHKVAWEMSSCQSLSLVYSEGWKRGLFSIRVACDRHARLVCFVPDFQKVEFCSFGLGRNNITLLGCDTRLSKTLRYLNNG
jgi:hypothetical protein